MNTRSLVTVLMILIGAGLMLVSYFFLATPNCNTSVACSNPEVAYASGIFILGILMAFSSAIFYSVYKGK
jgi:drug/metabolite transporter (DMT)-like permease